MANALNLRSLTLNNTTTSITDIIYQKYLKYLLPYQSHLLIDTNTNNVLPANPSEIFDYNVIVNDATIIDSNYNADIIQPYIDSNIFSLLNVPTYNTVIENDFSGTLNTFSNPTIIDNANLTIDSLLNNTGGLFPNAPGFKRGNLIYFTRVEYVSTVGTIYIITYNITTNTFSILFSSTVASLNTLVHVSNPVVDSNGNIFCILDTTNSDNNFGLVKFTSSGVYSFNLIVLPSGVVTPPSVSSFIIDSSNNYYLIDFNTVSTEVNVYLFFNYTLNTPRIINYSYASNVIYNAITNKLLLSNSAGMHIYDLTTLNLLASFSRSSYDEIMLAPSQDITLSTSLNLLNYDNGINKFINIAPTNSYGIDGNISTTGTIATINTTINSYDSNIIYFLEDIKTLPGI